MPVLEEPLKYLKSAGPGRSAKHSGANAKDVGAVGVLDCTSSRQFLGLSASDNVQTQINGDRF